MKVNPVPSIAEATIHGEDAATGAFAKPLGERFRTVREGKILRLWKRY